VCGIVSIFSHFIIANETLLDKSIILSDVQAIASRKTGCFITLDIRTNLQQSTGCFKSKEIILNGTFKSYKLVSSNLIYT
jgi:hypothetical protein